jgi:hypothetical protein
MADTALTIERGAVDKIETAVHSLARSALLTDLSGAERIARLSLAVDAARSSAILQRADPYRDGRYSRLLDAGLASGKGGRDAAAAERLALGRVAEIARATQTPGDNPGLLPATLVPPDPTRPPVPFLDLIAVVVADMGSSLDVAQAWSPPPMGVVDPTPVGDPVTPIGTHSDVVKYPTHFAAASVNVSVQLTRWGLDTALHFDAVCDFAASRALEAALIADLIAAAAVAVDATAGLRGALDSAEAQSGAAWHSVADVIVTNPADWPDVRAVYAPGAVPFTIPVVTGGIPAGTALVFPRSGVVAQMTAAEWFSKPEPGVVGMELGCDRFGAAGPREPAAVAKITAV